MKNIYEYLIQFGIVRMIIKDTIYKIHGVWYLDYKDGYKLDRAINGENRIIKCSCGNDLHNSGSIIEQRKSEKSGLMVNVYLCRHCYEISYANPMFISGLKRSNSEGIIINQN